MRLARSFAAAAALVAGLCGCGGGGLAAISGAVTYEGTPVGEGYVTFTPADGKGPDAGGPIAAGRYSVAGMTPGRKVVKVVAVKKVNFASTSAEMQAKGAAARKAGNYDGLVDPADTIPAEADGNNVTVDVVAGSQTRDFHLKKPVAKGKAAGGP
jgi:hypothetical protein